MSDSRRFLDKYLGEIIDYGGEPYTRAEVILDMQSKGIDQPCIDRWLQGYEHAQRRRESRQSINLKVYLSPGAPSSTRLHRH